MGVSCHLLHILAYFHILPQSRYQIFHMFNLEIFRNNLSIDLSLQSNGGLLSFSVVSELLIGDEGIQVEVVIMNTHTFNLIPIILLHHHAVYSVGLFGDAHF